MCYCGCYKTHIYSFGLFICSSFHNSTHATSPFVFAINLSSIDQSYCDSFHMCYNNFMSQHSINYCHDCWRLLIVSEPPPQWSSASSPCAFKEPFASSPPNTCNCPSSPAAVCRCGKGHRLGFIQTKGLRQLSGERL